VSLSTQIVDQIFQGEEKGSCQHHRTRCFKWDHRLGMIHSIARMQDGGDYGALVTVALRPQALLWVFCDSHLSRNHSLRNQRFLGRSITCILQFTCCKVGFVPRKPSVHRRSGCPVSVSLEVFGDRWSLLIVRDLMVRGYHTFKQFLEAGEGIASNILADRLQKLERSGIITAEHEETDNRRINYRLTEKGIDLAPVMLDLLIWGARHEPAGASCSLLLRMEKNRQEILEEVRRRWESGDTTPLIPQFNSDVARSLARRRNVSKERL